MKIPTLKEIYTLVSQIDKLEDEKDKIQSKIDEIKVKIFPPGYKINYDNRSDSYYIEFNGQIKRSNFITYDLAIQGAWELYFPILKSEKIRLQNEINNIDKILGEQ